MPYKDEETRKANHKIVTACPSADVPVETIDPTIFGDILAEILRRENK